MTTFWGALVSILMLLVVASPIVIIGWTLEPSVIFQFLALMAPLIRISVLQGSSALSSSSQTVCRGNINGRRVCPYTALE